MKHKIGKILIPSLLLVLLFGAALVLYHALPVEATPIGDVRERLGSFTGPTSGVEQDDNIKASLDLIHDLIGAPSAAKGTGEVYYVDSGASGGATGLNWTDAALTIDAGVGLCTADRGDFILVAAGHAENLAATDAIDVDLAGITIIGLGVGENRPVLTHTHANGELVIGADDTAIYNLVFRAGITAVTNAINIETTDENWIIKDCVFDCSNEGTHEFVDAIIITATGADGGRIEGCVFNSGVTSNGDPDTAIWFADCNDLVIVNNVFEGDYVDACIFNETTKAQNLLIDDNVLVNGILGGAAGLNTKPVISLHANTSGVIKDNTCICNVATSDLAIVAADCWLSGNTYNETEGGIANATPIGLIAGQTYAVSMTSLMIDDDMFTVAGGSILITSLVGEITTVSQTQANAIEIVLDADNTFDHDFTTAVETSGDLDGDRYVFDATATESVLTPCTGADGGSAGTMVHWYCSAGVIEINAAQATHTGAIKWFMTFIPLEEGVTVTPM